MSGGTANRFSALSPSVPIALAVRRFLWQRGRGKHDPRKGHKPTSKISKRIGSPSGFIVHSPVAWRNKTEIDVLAVRFPKNAEPERGVGAAEELVAADGVIDIVIGEVKSRGRQLQFNEALRSSPPALSSVLRWVGLFEEEEIQDLAQKLSDALAPDSGATKAPPTVSGPRGTRLRGILFSPERCARRGNQPWFLPGPAIFGYIWRCFRPPAPRPECATVYDFGLWGTELKPVVRYFKDAGREHPGSLADLLEYLGVEDP